jgi:hypothetical protein
VASIPLAGPRTGHFAFRLPTGVVGLAGGVDGQGQALTSIEMYTPGLVD